MCRIISLISVPFYFFLCIFLVSDFAVAQDEDEVLTPEKVYAISQTEALIPCVADAPFSDMSFHKTNQPNSIRSRMSTIREEGDSNILLLVIQDVQPSDAGKFVCGISRSSLSETELVVFDPTYPRIVVTVEASNDVLLKWNPPAGPRDAVTAYKLYVTEVADSVGVATFDILADPDAKEQKFVLQDLKPGATYDIQMSAVYIVGPDDEGATKEGPKCPKVRIETPQFVSPPVMVKAIPWKNSSILVTWKKPTNLDPRAIDGYTVVYKAVHMKKHPISGEVNVSSQDANNQWSVVLKGLRPKVRYVISVYAIQNGVEGRKSQSIIFRHDGFAPELSIRAVPLGPEIALVTVEIVGAKALRKLRILYADDTATKWKRVGGCKFGQHCVIRGLQPRSKYYFSARARVNRRSRQVVTHIMTPPTALDMPIDLEVAAQTDHSIKTKWNYAGRMKPIGYILRIEVKEDGEEHFRPFKEQVVFDSLSAKADGLRSREQYRAQVVPFDADGMGLPSDIVLFSIAPHGIDATTIAPGQSDSRPVTFIEIPAHLIEVDKGENVSLPCTAVGVPHPVVQWVVNDSAITQPLDRRNVLNWHGIQESMIVTCIADNGYQKISFHVRIQVSHGLKDHSKKSSPLQIPQKPTLAEKLPMEITKNRGDPLYLRCRFTGNPTPEVTWYQMNQPIGQQANSESILAIPSVEKSATLRCEGRNTYGFVYHIIELIVENTDSKLHQPGDYLVSMRSIPIHPQEYQIKWVIDQGDLDAISYFEMTVATDGGVVIMRDNRLAYDQRLMLFKDLSFGVRYIITLKTFTAKGMVDDSTIDFVPSAYVPRINDEPMLLVEAVEIRHNRARIDLTSLTPVNTYRLQVKDLFVRQIGNTILEKRMAESMIKLDRLKPNRRYQVIAEGNLSNGRGTVSASLIFQTPSLGGTGISVASRSDKEESTTAATTPTTMPDIMTTTATTARATTFSTTTTTTTTTSATTLMTTARPRDDNSSYQLKVKTAYKTPYQVDIRWTVDVGDLAAINNFLVTIKQARFTLVEQQVLRDQRSITIQSLTPSTRYYINLKARSAVNRVLAESDVILFTPSADAVVDTSNPFLDLEANEIRSSSTRLEWTVINGDPKQVRGYTLKVLDRDANGVNLLTKNMASSSQSINLRQLPPSRQFFVILEALGRGGQVMMSSSLTFSTSSSPSQYGIPVKASTRSAPLRRPPPKVTTTKAPRRRDPLLELEIRPALPDGARLNWTIQTDRNRPVSRYLIRVHLDDANSKVIVQRQLSQRKSFYMVTNLHAKTNYYMEIQAQDRYGRTIAKASSSYLLPPPGHNVEPIRASSRSHEQGKIVIDSITSVNSTAITLFWQNDSLDSPSNDVMIRYAKFDGNARTGYTLKYLPGSLGQAPITGLEPGGKYGFQIAKAIPGKRFVQWSDLYFFTNSQQ